MAQIMFTIEFGKVEYLSPRSMGKSFTVESQGRVTNVSLPLLSQVTKEIEEAGYTVRRVRQNGDRGLISDIDTEDDYS